MAMTFRQLIGKKGERAAAEYLKEQGYEIVDTNFRCPFGEVDIIAQKDDVVAFVEVKTRSGTSFGMPNEAVGADRRARYIACAKYYFSGRQTDFTVRFDIIEVLKGEINHIECAFTA